MYEVTLISAAGPTLVLARTADPSAAEALAAERNEALVRVPWLHCAVRHPRQYTPRPEEQVWSD